ncbi:MAG TPA: hypothetical protein DDY68_06070, partial [Porphyromonadaceae bacterium]|nr:hypothetical protein [Porphyromonadaceae bacterium]
MKSEEIKDIFFFSLFLCENQSFIYILENEKTMFTTEVLKNFPELFVWIKKCLTFASFPQGGLLWTEWEFGGSYQSG